MTAAGKGWLAVAERGSLLGMYFILACYRLFGRRICAYLIIPIVGYFFVTGRAARRASRDYLARLYGWSAREGHRAVARAPGWRDSFRHFHEFALNIIDRVSFFISDTDEFETCVHGRDTRCRGVVGSRALVRRARTHPLGLANQAQSAHKVHARAL